MKAKQLAALVVLALLVGCARTAGPNMAPERTVSGMTADQARDQIVRWCVVRGASVDLATSAQVTCSGLPEVLATGGGPPLRYQLRALIASQEGGVRVIAWPHTGQVDNHDMPAHQRREVQAMLDDLHSESINGPAITDSPTTQPVAPPAAPPTAPLPRKAVGVIPDSAE